MNLKRSLAASATLVVALSLSACGDDGGDGGDGGGDGGGSAGAPEDASTEDFCKTFTDMGTLDDDATSDEQAEAVNELADRMEEVGTPEGIEEDARNGFEVMVDVFGDIDGKQVDELDKLGGDDAEVAEALDISEDDVKDIETFVEYASTTCAKQMMEESPTDTPTQ